jgi:hypothetical protein
MLQVVTDIGTAISMAGLYLFRCGWGGIRGCAVRKNHKAGLVGPAVLLWNWFVGLVVISESEKQLLAFSS